jgi:type I restriction enzyme R subunit
VDAGTKLSERDVCTKLITPALVAAGWDVQTQISEEVGFTKGRIIVRGRLVTRPWTVQRRSTA